MERALAQANDNPGSSSSDEPLEARSRDELYDIARALRVRGRASMAKHELIKAIRRARAQGR
jgi:hypothetical protein